MRKNHSINLLPPRLQQQRRRHKLLCIMAAAQVVVFLLLGGTFIHLRGTESRLLDYSAALTARIDLIDLPLEIGSTTQSDAAQMDLTWAQVEPLLPQGFDPAWLQAILGAVPPDVSLSILNFDGAYIVLTALADNMGAISEHQRLLHNTGLFEGAHIGATQRLDTEQTRYTLRLLPLPAAPHE